MKAILRSGSPNFLLRILSASKMLGKRFLEEDRAAVEAFYSHFFNLTKEQMEFAGTYRTSR